MGRRKSGGFIEDLVTITAKAPWWVGVLLAVGAYLALHAAAQIEPPRPGSVKGLADSINTTVIRTLGTYLQYLFPIVFLIGAGVSAYQRRRREQLVADVTGRADASALLRMSWRDFERLVGELFRRRGYSVQESSSAGPDGGVDLVLSKGTERFLVQCKQWRGTMVGVDVVRQLFGVMAAQGATGGFVVSAGRFSPDAAAFAKGRNIELVGSEELLALVVPEMARPVAQAWAGAPACPRCGSPMARRTARRGANVGGEFWGCSRFPDCRGGRAG